jgi:hypothetical protein
VREPTGADAVGLCGDCRWMRVVTNRRGSRFIRCGRADTDARFVRYPPLPVLHCIGYEPGGERAAPQTSSDGSAGPVASR